MIDSFYIAWKYLRFNKVKTATLIACITLVSFLPGALQLLLNESERQLMSRAVSTPLIVGAKGSALDLVMNSLYFDDEVPELITMEAVDQVMDTGLAIPIPLYVRFQVRNHPIVGTTLDYFEFRKMHIAEGRQMAVLGDCVLGARAARVVRVLEEAGVARERLRAVSFAHNLPVASNETPEGRAQNRRIAILLRPVIPEE